MSCRNARVNATRTTWSTPCVFLPNSPGSPYRYYRQECNNVGVYEITYIYCECTPANFKTIEACLNCMSVNATEEATMQQLLDGG